MPSFWSKKEIYVTRKVSGLSRNGPLGSVFLQCKMWRKFRELISPQIWSPGLLAGRYMKWVSHSLFPLTSPSLLARNTNKKVMTEVSKWLYSSETKIVTANVICKRVTNRNGNPNVIWDGLPLNLTRRFAANYMHIWTDVELLNTGSCRWS